MKKIIFSIGLIMPYTLISQVAAFGTPHPSVQYQDWYKGGNTGLPGSTANIFGTFFNSPIYTYTNSTKRMKLNGFFTPGSQYPINGYTGLQTVNTSGYMLLGNDGPSLATGLSIYDTKGAFSLLHLNGPGTQVQELGYRSWMQTGITFTGNSDLSYIGLRKIGTAQDNSETVFGWSDNPPGLGITDEMCFRFMGQTAGPHIGLENTTTGTDDEDGLHIMRFNPNGRVGLGSTFGNTEVNSSPANYVGAQSLLHLSYAHRVGANFEPYGFSQITYRQQNTNPVAVGTGETLNDGLRFGIDNDIQNSGSAVMRHLNAYLRWQEASSLVIQTDSDDNPGNIENSERLRVTSVGAVTMNQGALYGGLTSSANTTRVAISQQGDFPVTQPMSLLHLGYNTGGNSSQVANFQDPLGWRPWMDLGMFVSNRKNHVFLGLKSEETSGAINNSERMDAVLAWGDRSKDPASADVFRFIFSANQLDATENTYSRDLQGSEMFRIYPGFDRTYTYDNEDDAAYDAHPWYGKVGIGDFSALGVNQQPTQKLDVIGNARLRYLPDEMFKADEDVKKYVMVDEFGVLRWTDAAGFVACSSTGGQLSTDSKIDLNNKNFYFTDQGDALKNRVLIGFDCVATTANPAKLNVWQDYPGNTNTKSIAAAFENKDQAGIDDISFYGIVASATAAQNPAFPDVYNVAGAFTAGLAHYNKGITASVSTNSINTYSYGLQASVTGASPANSTQVGVSGLAGQGAGRNIGVWGKGFNATNVVQHQSVGGKFEANTGSNSNFGVWSTAYGPAGSNTRSGYFNGTVEVAGMVYNSDQMFKNDIRKETDVLKRLKDLKPVNYKFNTGDFQQFGFPEQLQHGLVAQDLMNVFPELVIDSYHPGEYDSLNNEIVAPLSYKSINYNGLTTLNTQGLLELNEKVDKQTLSDQSLKTNVNDLSNSLDKVLALRGVVFDWDYTGHPEMNFDSAHHVGFIAQEVNQVDPLLTFMDDDNYMHVDYNKVVPVVVESIDELNAKIEDKDSVINALNTTVTNQQATINDLNDRLARLESCLSTLLPTLCEMNQQAIQQTPEEVQRQLAQKISVTLSNRNTIVLAQNVPNPFAESTVIDYSIPSTVQQAQIHFYDANGKLINSVDIVERGNGQLTVFANDLSSGIYTYSLVADGKVVATKKMMKK